MLNKMLSFISTICILAQVYLDSIIDINKIKYLIKKAIINFMIMLIIGGTILISIWFLVLGLGFFYLLSIQFTYIQAIAILLGVNVVVFIGLFIWFLKLTRRAKIIQNNSNNLFLLNNLLILIQNMIQKKD